MTSYDAIVVGGGVSGLVAALRLARAGLRVSLFEQNHQLGGMAAGIRRRDHYFDVGCQSVIDGGILFPLLDSIGALDERWRRVQFRVVAQEGDMDFIARHLDQLKSTLAAADPGAARRLDAIFSHHRRISAVLGEVSDLGLPHVRDDGSIIAALPLMARLLREAPMLWRSFAEPFETYYARNLAEGPARALLSTLGYPGMSTFFAAAVWHCWCHDYWYPAGGLQAWIDDLGRRLIEAGGEVHLKSPVARAIATRGRCVGIELEDGSVVDGRAVVFAIDLPQVLQRRLGTMTRRTRVDTAALTTPLLACYIGLSWPPAVLRERMGAPHLFHIPAGSRRLPAEDRHGHSRCWIQIAGHSAFDPGASRSSVVVQCFTDASWQNRYGIGAGETLPRPPSYKELTEVLREDLVAALERALPGAASAVTLAQVGTPLSTERFTRSPLGSSAGFSWYLPDVPLSALGWRRPELEGVYTCGQTTIWPGSVATSALSGKIAADLLLHDRDGKRVLFSPLSSKFAGIRGWTGRDRGAGARSPSRNKLVSSA
ncbi:MAG TPA: NAD(P)/FAD-dependent oxidoreductase [Sorangium sp.]|nr:NAD(P)/FAD-dependent oxidoreductase [Sorangium sp.]